jgi:4-amino-4-deoxy-L-arabinose transferase-like glycosyltransferase
MPEPGPRRPGPEGSGRGPAGPADLPEAGGAVPVELSPAPEGGGPGRAGRAVPLATGERLAVAALAAAAGTVALLISWSVLELVPHVTDSVSYLFQGRILAAGRLYEPPPAVPALFAQENVLLTPTRWCSKYPPGWPLLLALGWRLHAPWLISPLLLALAVAGVWLAGRRLYDPATGLLAAAALACSPFALLMAADAMAHVPALCASAWCLAMIAGAIDEGDDRRRRRRLLAAGLLGGFALLIRPLTALTLLAPAVAWCGFALWRRRRLAELAWMAAGAAPCLAVLAAYNAVLFGGPLTSGYAVAEPARFGSGGGAALVPLAVALLHSLPWYLGRLNRCLWGFPWGDLVFLAPLLWTRPRRAADGMLAACAACLIVAHSFYFYGDVIYSGPRFAFESLAPLSLLATRSLRTLGSWLAAGLERLERLGSSLAAPARRALRLAAAGAAGCALLYFPLARRLPEQMLHHAGWYLAVSAAPLRAAVRAGVGPDAMVLVAGTPWCYSIFFLANDPPPETARRVFVRDVPPLRAAALAVYPRPEVWVARVEVVIPNPRTDPDVARPTALSWRRLR